MSPNVYDRDALSACNATSLHLTSRQKIAELAFIAFSTKVFFITSTASTHNNLRRTTLGKYRRQYRDCFHTSCRSINMFPRLHASSNADKRLSVKFQNASSNLARSLSTSTGRILSPLRRFGRLPFRSKVGSYRSESDCSSVHPMEANIDNDQHGPAVPPSRAREPSNTTMQHNRISAHFDDNSEFPLCTVPVLPYHLSG